jgi:signal transduction histidine kinase
VRPRSLRVRFVLTIAVLVALVLIANGLVLALAGRPHLREDVESRARAYARLAVGPICNAYETYYASGYSKFRELLLDTMRLEPDLVRLALYDTGGRLQFDSRELADEGLNPVRRPAAAAAASAIGGSAPSLLAAVKGMSLAAWGAQEGGRPVYVVAAPYVEEWGRHRYTVVFWAGYDSLGRAGRAAMWRIIWLSAGSLALGVLIAIGLAAQSVGPLEVLTRGAQDLADGRLGRRIELPTGDEFGALAATFNQMAEKLARTISDLEASNRALERMNLDLQQLDRMKSDLLANVSHELRTPLTAIQGYAEAMEEGLMGAVTREQRDALAVVQRNGRRLVGMIEQLLGFSRLEAGVGKLELAAFDLGEVAAQVVGSVRAGHGQKVDLRHEALAAGLPPVWGDAGRIAQVLENLVTNAVKFTPAGGEVRVRLRRRGPDEVEVEVADRGIGIPAAAQPKVYDRFYQVDGTSTRGYGGLGLGLAIVREILAAHGRGIVLESEEGMGTTFRFSLPCAGAAGGLAAGAGPGMDLGAGPGTGTDAGTGPGAGAGLATGAGLGIGAAAPANLAAAPEAPR